MGLGGLTRLLRIPGLGAVPGPVALASAVIDRIDPSRYRGRWVWRSGSERLYIGVHGVTHGGALVRAVESELRGHPMVHWVVVNAALGSAVIACDDDVSLDELIDSIESVEGAFPTEATRKPQRPVGAGGPGAADATRRAATALVADAVGLSVAGAGRLLKKTPLPVEIAALVTYVEHQPRLRGAVENALGPWRADVVLSLANAIGQALAQGNSGLVVDMGQRALQLAEARACRASWRQQEEHLTGTPFAASAQPVVPERPVPLPPGPIERHADQAGLAAIGAFGTTLALSRSPRRAGTVAVSTIPKAAKLGREGFAATMGRILARRGVVLMDPGVLRRLDRITTVVLDSNALLTGGRELGDLLLVGSSDAGLLTATAHSLFRPAEPRAECHRGEFTLAPFGPGERAGPRAAQARDELTRQGAVDVLGLRRGSHLEALVGVVAEPAAAADALAAAARRAGLRLVVAAEVPHPDVAGRPEQSTVAGGPDADATIRAVPPWGSLGPPGGKVADDIVSGGEELVASVRELQASGAGVLLVSRQRRALVAADCGLGVADLDGNPAWGAHVLLGSDLTAAALVIEAAGVAVEVSKRSVTVARLGTALGAAMALGGTPSTVSGRTLLAVDGAAAIAMASGVWSATELGRRPVIPPVSHTPWHMMPVETVLSRLDAGSGGLSGAEARRRRRVDQRAGPAAPSLARAFAADLANPLTPILVGGAALSASIGAVVDAGIIGGVTAVSALMGAVQRVMTERAVSGLLEQSATVTRVLRDGSPTMVSAVEVVVGDVVVLEPGDVVPADCRILLAEQLEVDESSLTGESLPVFKQVEPVIARDVAERRSMLYESTTVAAGRARGVVVATGRSTEVGRTTAATRSTAPVAGVEARLSQITRITLPLALGSAGAVVATGLLRGHRIRETLGAGVGLAVASVPEGLPFLVSAAQLAAARRLSAQGALVRNPRTIEALGRVDVLCFDKTGTLTEGRLELRAVSDGRHEYTVDDARAGGGRAAGRAVLAAGLRATPQPAGGERVAHSTDRAVLRGAAQARVERTDGRPGWQQRDVLPFEPSRGYHATFGTTDDGVLLSVKGAPELVIPRCVSWRGTPLDADDRRALTAATTRLARGGYRVLAVAERLGGSDSVADLDFVGFLMFADPVRATAGASVRDLRDAGVQVVMITGDHPDTAEAIADELDVLNSGRVVTGADLDALDDDALDAVLPEVAVVARGTPGHKVRVVQAFQRLGRTVAMTGDGANDAAAIRLADVGIALGHRGTPAARAAADLVVTDDRVETILAALVEGRAMWGSVRKALGILVGGNLGEIAYTLAGTAVSGVSPLSARQLLLVNLLTDLAPALAVALRAPEAETVQALLAEGPEASLGSALTREVTVRAAATAAAAGGAMVAARLTGRPTRARTVGLAALVGAQLGQTLLAGGRSPAVIGASVGSAAVMVLVIQTPGLSQFFGCTPLGPVGWALSCGAATLATAGTVLNTPGRAAEVEVAT